MVLYLGSAGAGVAGGVNSGAGGSLWWPNSAELAWDAVYQKFMKGGVLATEGDAISFARASAARKSDGSIAAINAKRQEATGLLYEPAGDNLIATAIFTGATAGVIGSGGAVPSPWQFSNNSYIREVVSKSKDKIRIRVARTGAAPSGTSVTFRSHAFGAYQIVTGPVAAQCKLTLISFSGAFSNLVSCIQELTSGDVFVNLTNSSVLTTAGQATEETIWRNIPAANKATFGVIVNMSHATADFECVYELELPQMEHRADATMTSLMNSEDVTDPRSADVVTMLAPHDGAKFVGSFYEGGGFWDNPTIASGQHILVARGSRSNRLKKAFIMPGDITVEQRGRFAERVAPPAFVDAGLLNRTVGGQVYSQHKPTGATWAIQAAANKSDRYRFETRPGAYWSGDTLNDRHRAELTGGVLAFDADIWYSDWFRIVSVDWNAVAVWLIAMQLHQTEDAGESASPVLAFEFTPAGMRLVTRTYPGASGPIGNPGSTPRYTMPEFKIGQWYRRVMRTKLNNAAAGELQLWMDGSEKINLSGISNCYPDAVAPYAKFGIYSGNAMPVGSISTVIEYARVECGLVSLASRVATPLDLV